MAMDKDGGLGGTADPRGASLGIWAIVRLLWYEREGGLVPQVMQRHDFICCKTSLCYKFHVSWCEAWNVAVDARSGGHQSWWGRQSPLHVTAERKLGGKFSLHRYLDFAALQLRLCSTSLANSR